MVENWQNKRGGFATSGHRAGEYVAALECRGYCLSLNWSWSLKAQLFKTLVEAGVEL